MLRSQFCVCILTFWWLRKRRYKQFIKQEWLLSHLGSLHSYWVVWLLFYSLWVDTTKINLQFTVHLTIPSAEGANTTPISLFASTPFADQPTALSPEQKLIKLNAKSKFEFEIRFLVCICGYACYFTSDLLLKSRRIIALMQQNTRIQPKARDTRRGKLRSWFLAFDSWIKGLISLYASKLISLSHFVS